MAGAMLFERSRLSSSTSRDEEVRMTDKMVSTGEMPEDDEENIRAKEQGILNLGEKYKKEGKAKELVDLIKATRPFLSLISKAKAAKLVRSLVDFFLDLEAGIGIEVQLCKECIEWAKEERRTFLRQSLEARLIALYYDTGKELEAMRAVATASHKRSLADFQAALKTYKPELEEDAVVRAHLGALYDTMLEQNLCRIV